MAADGANGYDAVVIGGGHNGLVAAAYLAQGRPAHARARAARDARRRDDHVGARARHPRADPGPHRRPAPAVGRPRPRPQAPRAVAGRARRARLRAAARRRGDRPVGRRRPAPPRACARRSAADAGRYAAFDRLVRSLAGFLGEIAGQTPPDIESPGLADALAGLKLGRTFRGLGRQDGRTITRVLPMAVADFVAESFETDALRAAIAWRGIQYTAMGPWSAGTTAVLLGDSAGNDGGAAGQTVFARGGPGALVEALESAAREAGVEIRTGAEVVAITSRDGRATGVVLADGEEIERPRGRRRHRPEAHPDQARRPGRDRAQPASGGPATSGRRARSSKVNLALSALPSFTGGRRRRRGWLRGRIVIAPGIDAMERAHDDAKYGRLSETPIMEATIPSLADPTLVDGAPDGSHVMSVIVQCDAAYRCGTGSWDERRETLGDRVVAALDAYAPGLGGAGHRTPGHHPARPRARLRPDRRAPDARRARPRPVLPVAAAARPRPLPAGARRPVPRRRRLPPGRRRHRPERAQRRARDRRRPQAPPPLSDARPVRASRPAAFAARPTRRPTRRSTQAARGRASHPASAAGAAESARA